MPPRRTVDGMVVWARWTRVEVAGRTGTSTPGWQQRGYRPRLPELWTSAKPLATKDRYGAPSQPDEPCAVVGFRLPSRLTQGPAVSVADRHHLLRLDMLTMTRK